MWGIDSGCVLVYLRPHISLSLRIPFWPLYPSSCPHTPLWLPAGTRPFEASTLSVVVNLRVLQFSRIINPLNAIKWGKSEALPRSLSSVSRRVMVWWALSSSPSISVFNHLVGMNPEPAAETLIHCTSKWVQGSWVETRPLKRWTFFSFPFVIWLIKKVYSSGRVKWSSHKSARNGGLDSSLGSASAPSGFVWV